MPSLRGIPSTPKEWSNDSSISKEESATRTEGQKYRKSLEEIAHSYFKTDSFQAKTDVPEIVPLSEGNISQGQKVRNTFQSRVPSRRDVRSIFPQEENVETLRKASQEISEKKIQEFMNREGIEEVREIMQDAEKKIESLTSGRMDEQKTELFLRKTDQAFMDILEDLAYLFGTTEESESSDDLSMDIPIEDLNMLDTEEADLILKDLVQEQRGKEEGIVVIDIEESTRRGKRVYRETINVKLVKKMLEEQYRSRFALVRSQEVEGKGKRTSMIAFDGAQGKKLRQLMLERKKSLIKFTDVAKEKRRVIEEEDVDIDDEDQWDVEEVQADDKEEIGTIYILREDDCDVVIEAILSTWVEEEAQAPELIFDRPSPQKPDEKEKKEISTTSGTVLQPIKGSNASKEEAKRKQEAIALEKKKELLKKEQYTQMKEIEKDNTVKTHRKESSELAKKRKADAEDVQIETFWKKKKARKHREKTNEIPSRTEKRRPGNPSN